MPTATIARKDSAPARTKSQGAFAFVKKADFDNGKIHSAVVEFNPH